MDSSKLDIPALAAAGALLISVFLPVVSFMGISVNMFAGWEGKLVMLSGLAAGVLIFMNSEERPIGKFATVAGGVAALLVLYVLIQFLTKGIPFGAIGFGLYISLIAAIATVVLTLKYWKQSDS